MTDEKLLNSPMEWPRWPLLPLVSRSRSFRENDSVGFLVAQKTPPFIVYVSNIYDVVEKAKDMSIKTWGEAVKGVTTLEYQDANSLLADWRID